MPWYDYQCEKCGFVFEVQRAMSDTGKVQCKSCNSTRTVKIFTPAGIQFKGSGFYVTDSRNGSTNGAALPAEVDPAPVDSDAKPEQKAKPASEGTPAKAPAKPKASKPSGSKSKPAATKKD